MFYLDKTLGLILIGMTCLLAILPATLKRTLDTATKNYSNKLNLYTANLKDAFMGFEIIKAFTAEKNIKKGFPNLLLKYAPPKTNWESFQMCWGCFRFVCRRGCR